MHGERVGGGVLRWHLLDPGRFVHSSMWLRPQTVSPLEKCPLFRVSFIERVRCSCMWHVCHHLQELTVRLTDDLDPFFLFSLTLSEDDFLG